MSLPLRIPRGSTMADAPVVKWSFNNPTRRSDLIGAALVARISVDRCGRAQGEQSDVG